MLFKPLLLVPRLSCVFVFKQQCVVAPLFCHVVFGTCPSYAEATTVLNVLVCRSISNLSVTAASQAPTRGPILSIPKNHPHVLTFLPELHHRNPIRYLVFPTPHGPHPLQVSRQSQRKP